MEQPALLMLDDGTCFEGEARGACGESFGEVIFTTAMEGYQETLSDPSYTGQIVTFTSAHIGNYGIAEQDEESNAPCCSGAIFHDFFVPPAGDFPHWRAEQSLNEYLKKSNITAISGVDTRALTIHLREKGARNGIISAINCNKNDLLQKAQALPSMQGLDLASKVSCHKVYSPTTFTRNVPSSPQEKCLEKELHVAVLDFGVKRSILRHMQQQNMKLTIWPGSSSAEDILSTKPDGIFLSNGPGDPEPCTYAIDTVKKLLGKLPIFGICLGHQILGLALGAKTYKLPFGHHGINHPVKNLETGRVWITSQNHGFCVDPSTLPKEAKTIFWNLNDDTLEGLQCTHAPAFSVQFHPEAAPGPNDATALFVQFRTMMERTNH